MIRRGIPLILFGAVLCGFGLQARPALAEARSLQSFVQLKLKWDRFAEAETSFTLEGRIAALSGDSLRFARCPLRFRSADGDDFPRLRGSNRTVQVRGHMARENGRPVFLVEELKRLPSDLDRLRQKQAGLREEDTEGWYELARWAAGRARFYDDEELLEKAQRAFLKAVRIERGAIRDGQWKELRRLAERVRELDLPESVADSLPDQYRHTAFRWEWRVKRNGGKAALQELAGRLAEQWPGCQTPMRPPQPKLRKEYLSNPVDTYREAAAEERRKLHRIFYTEIVLAIILREAEDDGSNGFEIAEAIDERVPEKHALAETWRERKLEHRRSQLAGYSRREAVALSEEYRRGNRPNEAREVLREWLAFREKRLRRDGSAGLMRLADEYRELLEDEKQAARLLIEAHRKSPESDEIAGRLERLGYTRKEGRWISRDADVKRRRSRRQQAARSGLVTRGMSPEQVRKALGAPDSVTQIASAGRINAVWRYGANGRSDLAVHFLRYSFEDPAEAAVVRIVGASDRDGPAASLRK